MKKQRVVIELEDEVYETLLALKRVIGIGWKDLLIAGAVMWVELVEEKIGELKDKTEQIKKTTQ